MLKFLAPLVFGLVACTTVENDSTTNARIPFTQTQIDFQPPNRLERIRLIDRETMIFKKKEQALKDQIETLETEREILYRELNEQFPECQKQRHCLSNSVNAGVKRFERWEEIRKKFNDLDRQGIETEADLKDWKRRYDLRVRAIYNRYLVFEMLQVKNWNPSIRNVLVHSLEAFPNRRALSTRLLQLGDPDFVPTIVGDLNFRMLNQPVDEAAVLATFDIWLHEQYREELEPVRFMVTFLVNTHQLDPQYYEKSFLQEWADRLSNAGKERLRLEAYCGVYSIASPVLMAKLNPSKVKPCAPLREQMDNVNSQVFNERFRPNNWLLPVSYSKIYEQKDMQR